MKYIRYASVLVAVATAFTFFACNKSNPVTQNPPVRTFSFGVGSTFQFKAWSLDTLTNVPVASSLTYIHETIVDSGLTVGNVSHVYMAIDSSFDTTNAYIGRDTIYYSTNGNSISEYGLVASLMSQFANLPVTLAKKWNKIADNSSTSTWLVDTTSFGLTIPIQNTNVPITVATTMTGRDAGDSTLDVAGASLLGDHAVDSGSVNVTGTIIVPVTIGSMPLMFQVYTSYQPTIVARIYAPSTRFVSQQFPTFDFYIPGTERVLVSWQTK